MPLQTITDTLGFATSKHGSDVFNISPQDIHLSESGAGSANVTMMQDMMYLLPALQDVKSYKKAEYPVLSILANIQHSKADASTKYWSDKYESDAWDDIRIDDLRYSDKGHVWTDGAWDEGSYVTASKRGKLAFMLVTTLPSAAQELVVGNEINDDGTNALAIGGGDLIANFCFNKADDYIIGKKEAIIRKLAATLKALDYTIAYIEGGTKNYYSFTFTSGSSHPLYLCFEDFAYINVDDTPDTIYQDHEIITLLNKFYFNEDFSEIIFQLDFANSNADLTSSVNYNVAMQEIVGPTAENYSAGHSLFTSGCYMRLSRLALIQNFSELDEAVPEGSDFVEQSGYVFGQELKRTYSRIFQSKAWGVTGTRIAEKITFMDEFQETRKREMAKYKRNMNNSIYFARSFICSDVRGKPKHSFGGLLDYGLYPIRYMKEPLPSVNTSEANAGLEFYNWISSIAKSISQHKEGDGNSFTILCSDYVVTRITQILAYVKSKPNGNVFGYTVTYNAPSPNNLEIPNIEVSVGTASTKLYFVHDKSLDYMPSMPAASSTKAGIPAHLFSSSINPRTIMVVIDKTNAFMETLRPDQIYGNLQGKGEDRFKEAMRGEHLVYFRNPRNFTIIDATE